MRETGDLEFLDAGVDNAVEHLDFIGRGDDLGNGLEAVSGPTFTDHNRFRDWHGTHSSTFTD